MTDYGFAVHVTVDDDRGEGPHDIWHVELPHQCDEWQITWSDSKQQAIADLRQFITEARQALERLDQLQPCDHRWEPTGHENEWNNRTSTQFKCADCDLLHWKVRDNV